MSAVSNRILEHLSATDATDLKQLFLQGLRESGTICHAADFAGVNRVTAWRWRQLDAEFRQAWDAALEDVGDNVERSLYRQAVSEKNVVATIFWLKNNRAKYRDKLPIDLTSAQHEIEEQSRRLLGPAGDLNTTHSTKDIILEAIGIPLKRTDD